MYFIPRERCLVEGGHVFHTSGEVFGGGWPCTFYGLGCEPYHAHVFFFAHIRIKVCWCSMIPFVHSVHDMSHKLRKPYYGVKISKITF